MRSNQGMSVIVCLEKRFTKTPDGTFWTRTTCDYDFWSSYLTVFDEVKVLARVRDVADTEEGDTTASGPGVVFFPLVGNPGTASLLLGGLDAIRTFGKLAKDDAVILRVPSILSTFLAPQLIASGRPYGVEVVGDPYDSFAPGSHDSPLRPFLRHWLTLEMRRQVARASVASYVTERALQRRYPPLSASFNTHYSSIRLPRDAFVREHHRYSGETKHFRLITVGRYDHLYKATDVLIDAVAQLRAGRLDVELVVVGGGRYLEKLLSQARAAGLGDRVEFAGELPGSRAVFERLDGADLFILPSRQEGLPRAMIEAMARGLPCIGSDVGGIGELLPPERLVAPNDVDGLAQNIAALLSDPAAMTREAARNLEKAREYSAEALEGRRSELYARLRSMTVAFNERRRPTALGSKRA